MRKFSKRSIAVVAGTAAVIVGGGAAAWAVNGWKIGGDGEAEATAAAITKMTATSVFSEKLYPGLETEMVSKVTNDNDFPVKLVDTIKVVPAGVVVTPADAKATLCKNGILKTPDIIETDFPGTPTLTAKTADQEIKSSVKIGELPEDCAGKTIKVAYTFTGQSQA